MRRLPRALALLTLLSVEAAALVVLLRLGTRPPFAIPLHDIDGWLRATTPPDALAAVLRLVAIAVAGWLLISTIAYTVARAVRAPHAIRATAWAAVPAVRRIVDAALAASIVAGSVTGSLVAPPTAWAASTSPPTSSQPAVRDGRAPGLTAPTAAPAPPPMGDSVAATVVVVAGDDLWQIAARELARVSAHDGAGLDPAVLAGYWRDLCDTNLAALRSGDVNVIFPGEVITLPPHRAAPPIG